MPLITNTTSKDIWFPQIGETVPANSYIISDVFPVITSTSSVSSSTSLIPAGLTVDNTKNTLDPILFYGGYSSSQTVNLPTSILPRTAYTVKIFCTSGTMGVQFNNSGNTSFTIPATDVFEITCMSRTIDNIILSGSGQVYITVRKH